MSVWFFYGTATLSHREKHLSRRLSSETLTKCTDENLGDAQWLANCLTGQIQGFVVTYLFPAFHSSYTDNSPHEGPVSAVQLNRRVFGEADEAEEPKKTRWKVQLPICVTIKFASFSLQASAHHCTAPAHPSVFPIA